MSSVPIRTLLNCYPLAPTSLFEKLKTITPVLHNYPQLAGNDYTGAKAPLPPAEVLAEADSLLVFNLPANLVSIEQAPRYVSPFQEQLKLSAIRPPVSGALTHAASQTQADPSCRLWDFPSDQHSFLQESSERSPSDSGQLCWDPRRVHRRTWCALLQEAFEHSQLTLRSYIQSS